MLEDDQPEAQFEVEGQPAPEQNILLAWPWLALATFVVVFDQFTKAIVVRLLAPGDQIDVLPILRWVRWHNEGAAFSMLNDAGGWQLWMFVILGLLFVGFILFELRRLPVHDRLQGFVYGMILGGAIGNLIDRLANGYVVDFVLVHYQQSYFPAFNVADSALCIGAVLWLYLMLRDARTESRARARVDQGSTNRDD